MTDLVCPLCVDPLSAGPVNLDHVFGEALGGRAKADVHVACKEKIGGGAEGRVRRANSVLNFFASLNGISAANVMGTMPDGTKVTADFSTGQTTLAKPRILKGRGLTKHLNCNPKNLVQLTAAQQAQLNAP
jgi:hypothetical protein